MNRIAKAFIGVFLVMTANVKAEEEKGIVGRVYDDGAPVIYKFVNELPSEEIRRELTWLTVISWKYDGSSNNGMPLEGDNQRMILLEDTIEDHIERDGVLHHAYSRTGNSLKEFVYYIHDPKQFLEAFNQALSSHPRYPIGINFYQDEKWEDFQRLLNDFSKTDNK